MYYLKKYKGYSFFGKLKSNFLKGDPFCLWELDNDLYKKSIKISF